MQKGSTESEYKVKTESLAFKKRVKPSVSLFFYPGSQPGAILRDAARSSLRVLRVPLPCGNGRLAALWPAVGAAAHIRVRHGYSVEGRYRQPTAGRAAG